MSAFGASVRFRIVVGIELKVAVSFQLIEILAEKNHRCAAEVCQNSEQDRLTLCIFRGKARRGKKLLNAESADFRERINTLICLYPFTARSLCFGITRENARQDHEVCFRSDEISLGRIVVKVAVTKSRKLDFIHGDPSFIQKEE